VDNYSKGFSNQFTYILLVDNSFSTAVLKNGETPKIIMLRNL